MFHKIRRSIDDNHNLKHLKKFVTNKRLRSIVQKKFTNFKLQFNFMT